MSQDLIEVSEVVVGPKNLSATLTMADGIPLNTSQNIEATARVYWLLPEIADHACFGDDGVKFQDAMGDTELAHLIEHVAVELMARTNRAGKLSAGKTVELSDPRQYEVQLACPDDVLTSAALMNAIKIVSWAFAGDQASEAPDVAAIVDGMVYMLDKSYELEAVRDSEAANDSLGRVGDVDHVGGVGHEVGPSDATTVMPAVASAAETSVLDMTEKMNTAEASAVLEHEANAQDTDKNQDQAPLQDVAKGQGQDESQAENRDQAQDHTQNQAQNKDQIQDESLKRNEEPASKDADILQFDASKIPGNRPL